MKHTAVLSSLFALMVLSAGCSTANTNTSTTFELAGSWTGSLNEEITSLYIDGNILYAAAGYQGLLIFDVSDPAKITNIGRYPEASLLPVLNPYNEVCIRTVTGVKYAYIASGLGGGNGGIEVLNVTNATNVLSVAVSTNVAGANPVSIEVSDDGTKVYTADTLLGYKPYAVNLGGATITPGATLSLGGKTPADIALNGTTAYIPARENGFFVVDTAAGTLSAQLINSLLLVKSASVSLGILAVGDRDQGISYYDVSAADKPAFIARCTLSKYPVDICLYGESLFVADESEGLLKLKRTPPDTFSLEKQLTNAQNIIKLQYQSSTGLVFTACGVDGIRIYR